MSCQRDIHARSDKQSSSPILSKQFETASPNKTTLVYSRKHLLPCHDPRVALQYLFRKRACIIHCFDRVPITYKLDRDISVNKEKLRVRPTTTQFEQFIASVVRVTKKEFRLALLVDWSSSNGVGHSRVMIERVGPIKCVVRNVVCI